MSNIKLAAPSLALTVPRRVKLVGAAVVAVLVVVIAGLIVWQAYDHSHTPDYPDDGVRDWATFSDHLVVGRVTGKDTFLVTTVLWTRQGAQTAPRRIIWQSPPADLKREQTYALPVVWVTGHGAGHWSVLSKDAVLPVARDRLAAHAGEGTWVSKHAGARPQELAAKLYDEGPYPKAVPHLYQGIDARVASVEDH